MEVKTSRFGLIEIKEDDFIDFPEGLLGFNHLRRFVLLDDPNDEIFAWLQSCEQPAIAFPILEPELFQKNYSVLLTKHDLEALQLKDADGFRSFCIITIPENPVQMTANLKAPIVINVARRMARQCVLQDSQLAIREPIFTLLQQRVVQQPTLSIKSQAISYGMAVKIDSAARARSGSLKNRLYH